MLQKSRGLIFVTAVIATVLFSVAGCAGTQSVNRAQDTSSQSSTPKPISANDLKKLRWIEGAWRGTGDVEKPFYERYRFENESTLAVESFDDETLSKVTDVTRFELKDGQFGGGGEGSRWVATELTDSSITFSPVTKARNSFRWQKESDNS